MQHGIVGVGMTGFEKAAPRGGRRPAGRRAGAGRGRSVRQRSIACGQRVENTHPAGGFERRRQLALEHDALAAAGRPAPGVDASSACVYGCSGRAKMRSLRPLLHREAQVHDEHVVRDVPDDAEVVRDEEVGEPELALQVGEQVQHLRLHRDVERRDRLVGDDQRRIQHQRARDRDALPLAAREHVRIARVVLGPQADLGEHRAGALGALGRRRGRC